MADRPFRPKRCGFKNITVTGDGDGLKSHEHKRLVHTANRYWSTNLTNNGIQIPIMLTTVIPDINCNDKKGEHYGQIVIGCMLHHR